MWQTSEPKSFILSRANLFPCSMHSPIPRTMAGDSEESIVPVFPPQSQFFQCSERYDDRGDLVFHCKLRAPNTGEGSTTYSFQFATRERSIGVLLDGEETEAAEKHKSDDDHEEEDAEQAMDPFFFDSGYTLAATTGFQIWAGTRMLVDSIIFATAGDDGSPLLRINGSDCVVELGCGVGVVGTCWAAATGARVILTDLPTLVRHTVVPNIRKNSPELVLQRNDSTEEDEDDDDEGSGRQYDWTTIGRGKVLPLALDWTKDIPDRLKRHERVDWIIASDCVWLRSMLISLLDTVRQLFESHPRAVFLLSFQKRGTNADDAFTTPNSIYDELIQRNWHVERLAWRPVQLSDGSASEVYLWKVMARECYS